MSLEVKNVIQRMNNGYTHPFLVECTGTEDLFVIKAINDDTSGKTLFNELVCGRLARQLDMYIPDFELVYLSQEIINSNDEMVEYNFKPGYCFASLYKKGRGITKTYVQKARNKDRLPEIILFDQIILNNDRCARNDNIVFDAKLKEFYIIDHTEAFDVGQLWSVSELNHRMYNNPPSITSELKGVCYDNISGLVKGKNDFRRFLNAAKTINYEDLICDVPTEWEISDKDKSHILKFLKSRFDEIDDIIKELREHIFTNWKGAS